MSARISSTERRAAGGRPRPAGRSRRSRARRSAATRPARAPRRRPPSKSIVTSCRVVVPRTIESSTDDDAPPRDLVERIELHPDPLLAHALLRLDERARDVAVLDEPLVERDPRRLREADRGGRPRVRDRDHEIGVDRRLARELLAHADARAVHLDAGEPRVGPREVDVLEDAERARPAGSAWAACRPSSSTKTISPGRDVAHELRADEVERARLRREHPVLADAPERRADGTRAGRGRRRACRPRAR